MIDESEAIEAVRAALGESVSQYDAAGHQFRASQLERSVLWSVWIVESNNMVLPGSSIFVGPDRRVWTFSSNPGIHDFDLVRRSLNHIYEDGLADRVENDAFADRIAEITAMRSQRYRDILKDAEGGALRAQKRPKLP